MKRFHYLALTSVLVLLFAFSSNVNALVAVTVSNPGNAFPVLASSYTSLANAITALNGTISVSGPITLTCATSGAEQAPAGGYVIQYTAATSATNKIIIDGAGSTITAKNLQTAGALNDAVFKVLGSDYLTLMNFTMQENAANTVTAAGTNTMTEWGVALLYLSVTNGAQNCTIQGNTISLNRTYQNTFGIYSNSTHTVSSVTTLASATGATGGNNGLKIYSNNISNVNQGIIVVGPAAAADHSTGVDIGGAGSATGNTITNYGTTGTFSGYVNISASVNGIYIRNVVNYNISYNSITSSNGGTTSGTLRGIYIPTFSVIPTGASTNFITNNSVSVTTGASSNTLMGIFLDLSSGNNLSSVSINNNNFSNCGYTSGSASGSVTFISAAGSNLNTTINNNTFTNLNITTSGNVSLITADIIAPAGGTETISNNSIITAFTKTLSGNSVTGITNTIARDNTTITISNNNLSNINVTGITTITGYLDQGTGAANHSYTGNTLSNVTAGTGTILGMSLTFGSESGSPGNIVSGNTISNIVSSGVISGIFIASGTIAATVTLNKVNGLFSTGAVSVAGISSNGIGTTEVSSNTICNLQCNNAAGTVHGIRATTGVQNIVNNTVADIRTPSADAANSLIGLNITGGTVNAYYNTISLDGFSSGVNFGSSAVFAATSANVTFINNIFSNNSTLSGSGLTVAYRRSSTSLTSTNYTNSSNNNLFYAGTPSATRLIYYDGTNSDQTLTAFKSRVAPREAVSVTENLLSTPTFKSTTCGDVDFLHMKTTVATQTESGGIAVAGFTNDIDGNTRSATTPDIGADEFTGTPKDLFAPIITYTPLSLTCATGNISRTLSATITDNSGIPLSGINVPRIYYKKNTGGAYTSSAGALTSGNANNSTWDFTINTNVVVTDTIYYFIIAQDTITSSLNIGSNPAVGLNATSVNTVIAAPTIPASFKIAYTLNGDYTVGAGGFFTTITAAISEYNIACLSGPVRFLLTGATYPSETFPITILPNPNASAVNTLTIQPAASNPGTTTISGNVGFGLFKFEAANYITFNGSKNNSTSRDLIVTNTNSTTLSICFWLGGPSATAGSSNITIKNCQISCGAAQNSQNIITYGIISCWKFIIQTGIQCDNNTFENNSITKASYGIWIMGNSTVANRNTIIRNNIIGPSAFGNDQIGRAGIVVMDQDSAVIDKNEVRFVGSLAAQGFANGAVGIGAGGEIISFPIATVIKNSRITNNFIHDIVNEKTFCAVCIIQNAINTSPTQNLISNNMIYNVRANATSTLEPGAGIFLIKGNKDVVVYNSVSMESADIDPAGATPATSNNIGLCIQTGTVNLTLKNNISKVDLAGGSTTARNFSIWVTGATNAWGTGSSSNNCYYVNPSNSKCVPFAYGSSATETSSLSTWQTYFAPDQDSASVLSDPKFISSSNLHINPAVFTLVEKGGVPISGVTTDYDNDTRDAEFPDIGADEGAFIGNIYNDVAATAFISPSPAGNTTAGVGITPIAKVNNNSVVARTNVPVRYIVRGPLPSTAVVYNEVVSLSSIAAHDTVQLFFPLQTLAVAGNYTVQLITEQPNDVNKSNDTITSTLTVHIPMNGTYTVDNNNITSAGNYHSILAAVNDLILRGANGAVKFLLIDSAYNEYNFPVTITPWLGASATNTLTITDTTAYTFLESGGDHIFDLNNADHVIIDGLWLKADFSNGSSNYPGLIRFRNSATYNTVKNCDIRGNGSSFGGIIYFAQTDTGSVGNNYNSILNNVFNSGTYPGLYPYSIVCNWGVVTAFNTGNTVSGNRMSGFSSAAVYDNGYSESNIYTDNDIFNFVPQNRELYGFFLWPNYINGVTILRNNIHDIKSTASTALFRGLAGILGSGTGPNPALIADNMIALDNSTMQEVIGIEIKGSHLNQVYNNTIRISGSSIDSSACIYGLNTNNYDIKNNVLVNLRDGCSVCKNYVFKLNIDAPGFLSSKNNSVYTLGGAGTRFARSTISYATLAAWQAAGSDSGSFVHNAVFANVNDLHIVPASNAVLANKAMPIAIVTDDIDKQLRNGCPDMGADEFDFSGSYYFDNDGDLYGGSNAMEVLYCGNNPVAGYVGNNDDCNDTVATIHPGAAEVCGNILDDNCNGQTDEGCILTLNLKHFIEAYYSGSDEMNPILYTLGLSSDSTACDSITVELHHPVTNVVVNTFHALLKTNGTVLIDFDSSLISHSWYIVIRHHNAIETWSKIPVLFDAPDVYYDFTE